MGNRSGHASFISFAVQRTMFRREVNIENKIPSKSKRRKWDDDCSKYGFFLPKSEESTPLPSAQFLLCDIKYSNQCLAPSNFGIIC